MKAMEVLGTLLMVALILVLALGIMLGSCLTATLLGAGLVHDAIPWALLAAASFAGLLWVCARVNASYTLPLEPLRHPLPPVQHPQPEYLDPP